MKNLIFALAILSIASCATTSTPYSYRPPGSTQTVNITAKIAPQKGFNGWVYVMIDGQIVADGSLGSAMKTPQAVEGVWKGKRVSASVNNAQRLVMIFIDGQYITTLHSPII